MSYKSFVTIFLMLLGCSVFGQSNTHYWSYQYGAKGLMLNGAVIGSVDDETAIFYNPGAMGVNRKTGLAISLITPSYSRYRTENLIGDYKNIDVSYYGLAPGLVSGLFDLYKKRIIGGVTSFTRLKTDIDFRRRLTGNVKGSPDKFFVGEVNFDRRDREQWTGGGISFILTDKLSIGFTQFITLKRESLEFGFKREVLDRTHPKQLSEGWLYNFNYGIFAGRGFLTKLGISWQPKNYKLGFTFTSPTYLSVFSNGRYSYTDMKILDGGVNTSSSDKQTVELSTEYKTPWSIGFGASADVYENTFHFSMEYFSRIKPYYIIDHTRDPYEGLSDDPNHVRTTVLIGKKPVLNLAIGVEQFINHKTMLYYGARTDFNPAEVFLIDQDADYLGTAPNMFHFSVGTLYKYRHQVFSFGLDYGYGFKKNGPQLLDISNISRANIFDKPRETVTNVQAQILTIFITYSL